MDENVNKTDAAGTAAKTEETAKKTEEAAKKVKPTNCAKCNKPLKKLRQYYRNGKFYCTKRCWKEEKTKPEKE